MWWNLATVKAKTSRIDSTILLDGADDLIDAPPANLSSGRMRPYGLVAARPRYAEAFEANRA